MNTTRQRGKSDPDQDAPRAPAVGYRRTRRDHSTETAEDYVEAIATLTQQHGSCRVKDLVNRFGVSHVTVIRILSRLQREGLTHSVPYGPVELTRRGADLARRSRQRHATVVAFLLALGVSPATAEIDAEGIEHHVSPETLRRMRQFTKSKDG